MHWVGTVSTTGQVPRGVLGRCGITDGISSSSLLRRGREYVTIPISREKRKRKASKQALFYVWLCGCCMYVGNGYERLSMDDCTKTTSWAD